MRPILYSLVILFLTCVAWAQEATVNEPRDNDSYYSYFKRTMPTSDDNNLNFQVLDKVDVMTLNIPTCDGNEFSFNGCETRICKIVSPFGNAYFKINGITANKKCSYLERTSDVDGMDCEFEIKDLDTIGPLFNKRLNKLTGKPIDFTKEELDSLNSIYKNNCTLKRDYKLSKLVTLARDDFQSDIRLSPEDVAKLADIFGVSNSDSVLAGAGSSEYVANLENYRSIMFTQAEVDLIYLIQELLRTRNLTLTETSLLFSQTGIGKFYLASILYKGAQDWVVWINDFKITPKDKSSKLNIEKIDSDKVRFKWTTNDLSKISPNWKTKLIELEKNSFMSREYDILVKLDGEQSTIVFGLRPNQTFDINTMVIKEGD